MSSTDDEAFVAFTEVAMRDLRRTAYLLCGDWGHADDALQDALLKIYLKWHRPDKTGNVWGYARRAVVTAVIDGHRRGWRTRETTAENTPDVSVSDLTGSVDDRILLREALDALPQRQRAVIVLRFVDDLDVNETAYILRLPSGTVTSSTKRALASLKRFLTDRGVVRGKRMVIFAVLTDAVLMPEIPADAKSAVLKAIGQLTGVTFEQDARIGEQTGLAAVSAKSQDFHQRVRLLLNPQTGRQLAMQQLTYVSDAAETPKPGGYSITLAPADTAPAPVSGRN